MHWWLVTSPGKFKHDYATGGDLDSQPRDHLHTNSEELVWVKLNTDFNLCSRLYLSYISSG
jgi:hypothetical protein